MIYDRIDVGESIFASPDELPDFISIYHSEGERFWIGRQQYEILSSVFESQRRFLFFKKKVFAGVFIRRIF